MQTHTDTYKHMAKYRKLLSKNNDFNHAAAAAAATHDDDDDDDIIYREDPSFG